jgi:hypothetical protein
MQVLYMDLVVIIVFSNLFNDAVSSLVHVIGLQGMIEG